MENECMHLSRFMSVSGMVDTTPSYPISALQGADALPMYNWLKITTFELAVTKLAFSI